MSNLFHTVFPINALPAAQLVGEGIDVISHRADVKLKAVELYYAQLDADLLFCFSDIVIQADAMGAEIAFGPRSMPAVKRPAAQPLQAKAGSHPRMLVNVEVIRGLRRLSASSGCAPPPSTPLANLVSFVQTGHRVLAGMTNWREELEDITVHVHSGRRREQAGKVQRLLAGDIDPMLLLNAGLMRAIRKGDIHDTGITQHCRQRGMSTTRRYSPGHRDFPLEVQKLFVKLAGDDLSCLFVESNHILKPEKSITALKGCSPVW